MSAERAVANQEDMAVKLKTVQSTIEEIQNSSDIEDQRSLSEKADAQLEIAEKRLNMIKEIEINANALIREAESANALNPSTCGTKHINRIETLTGDIKHVRFDKQHQLQDGSRSVGSDKRGTTTKSDGLFIPGKSKRSL